MQTACPTHVPFTPVVPSIINRHHPHSLRCLGLNDIWSVTQGGQKEWGKLGGPCWPGRWEPWEDVEQRRGDLTWVLKD